MVCTDCPKCGARNYLENWRGEEIICTNCEHKILSKDDLSDKSKEHKNDNHSI